MVINPIPPSWIKNKIINLPQKENVVDTVLTVRPVLVNAEIAVKKALKKFTEDSWEEKGKVSKMAPDKIVMK